MTDTIYIPIFQDTEATCLQGLWGDFRNFIKRTMTV